MSAHTLLFLGILSLSGYLRRYIDSVDGQTQEIVNIGFLYTNSSGDDAVIWTVGAKTQRFAEFMSTWCDIVGVSVEEYQFFHNGDLLVPDVTPMDYGWSSVHERNLVMVMPRETGSQGARFINLGFQANMPTGGEYTTWIWVLRTQPFREVLIYWCNVSDVDFNEAAFWHKGKRLHADDSPDSLGWPAAESSAPISVMDRVPVIEGKICALELDGRESVQTFQLYMFSPFSGILDAWCSARGKTCDEYAFSIEGLSLLPQETPARLGLNESSASIVIEGVHRYRMMLSKDPCSISEPNRLTQLHHIVRHCWVKGTGPRAAFSRFATAAAAIYAGVRLAFFIYQGVSTAAHLNSNCSVEALVNDFDTSAHDALTNACGLRPRHASSFRGVVQRLAAELEWYATDIALLVESQNPSWQQTSIPGMPPVAQVMLGLVEDAELSYQLKNRSFQQNLRTRSLQGIAAFFIAAGIRFRRRARIRAQELHASLVLSEVLPKGAAAVVPAAKFHSDVGGPRFEVLLKVMQSLPLDRRQQVIHFAEVGVNTGYTSAYLLENQPNLHLVGIDPYEHTGSKRYLHREEQFEAVRQMLSRYGDRVELWKMSSDEAAKSAYGFLDMVFIDGDHSYEAVRNDIIAWAPKIRSGGVVSGHDYNCRHHGVVRAVNEHIAAVQATLHLGSDSIWWYYVG